LLYQAGLVSEAGQASAGEFRAADVCRSPAHSGDRHRAPACQDQISPVVFEVMPESFTLLQLQKAVEALAGLSLHKQNFRRMIEQQDLIEETGGDVR
jgi:hypothetical protein